MLHMITLSKGYAPIPCSSSRCMVCARATISPRTAYSAFTTLGFKVSAVRAVVARGLILPLMGSYTSNRSAVHSRGLAVTEWMDTATVAALNSTGAAMQGPAQAAGHVQRVLSDLSVPHTY